MPMGAITLSDRIRGGLVGLLVGDALGVPYEFHRPEDLPPHDAIEYSPPPGFERAHLGVPPGTWSDNGAQALCLLASLLESGRLDLEDFSGRLVRWYEEGYLAVDGVVFDVGITTGSAIRALRAGVLPTEAGPASAHDNGNGSLMRVLPLALWHRGEDEALVRDAHLQSRVTHGHMRSQACCALYCLWARRMLGGVREPWISAVSALRRLSIGRTLRLRRSSKEPSVPTSCSRARAPVTWWTASAPRGSCSDRQTTGTWSAPPSSWATTPTRRPAWPEALPASGTESTPSRSPGETASADPGSTSRCCSSSSNGRMALERRASWRCSGPTFVLSTIRGTLSI